MLRCFIAMPFHADVDWLYELIEELCKKYDIEPRRVDKISGVENIWAAIMEEIEECDFLIADLSRDPSFKKYDLEAAAVRNSCNSNVSTEAGYAMALKKPIIIMSNTAESLPFDFKTKLALIYGSDPKGLLFFQKTLENQIAAIQARLNVKGTQRQRQSTSKVATPFAPSTPAGFSFLRQASYTCNGITNTMQEYQHDRTGMEFVLIPGGTFQMGSNGHDNEKPIHQVTLSPFLMSKTQVTQGVWKAMMGSNPSKFQKGDDCPVEQVSWDDCQEFCQKVGLKLPTESQWEFACRAGSTTKWYWGNSESDADQYAWYDQNSGSKTHPVAQKSPNAYGLYDTAGNVWEWCQDWYADTYSSGSVTDPVGPNSGQSRVLRGGCWSFLADGCCSAFRFGGEPGSRSCLGGFRCVFFQFQ